MRTMVRQVGLAAAMAVFVGAAACSKPGVTDSELEQDLKQASSTSLQLAPQGAGTAVISDIEATPQARPAAAPQRVRAPQRSVRHNEPAPQPTRVAQKPTERSVTPSAEPEPTGAPAVRPAAPAQRPLGERPGVYRSEGEVLRNLPIPVNP